MIQLIDKPKELYPYEHIVKTQSAKWFYDNPIDIRELTYSDNVDVRGFSEAGRYFLENGVYVDAPDDSMEYDEYWAIQEERCMKGYQIGDLWITGRHYFYLNFFPMWKSVEGKNAKVLGFPDFWEIDYAWWIAKHIAKKVGLNLSVLKTRRSGFSYKEACDCIYNYNFIAGSKSYIYAEALNYLIKDRIMDKVKEGLDHINEHTIWYKNRQKKDERLHYRASYVVGTIEKGYKSDIIGQVLDDPDKARGGGAVKITFEEAGSFGKLLPSWQTADKQARENGIVTGQLTAFGTGGDMGDGLVGLESLFYNPKAYNILPFNNTFDEGMEGTMCGFFCSCIDSFSKRNEKTGKVYRDKAIDYLLEERSAIKLTNDPRAFDKHRAELPFTPKEALLKLEGNIFASGLCQEQEIFIMQNKSLQSSILYGELYKVKDTKGFEEVKFRPSKEVKDALNEYPIKKGTMTDGAVVIYQTPYDAENMYYLVLDPYAKDEAPESESVGACFVYKRASAILIDKTRPADCIVASYVARPKTLEEYLKNVFMLAQYYKAKIYFESMGGGQSVLDYARNNNMINYLAFQPIHLTNKEVASYKNRSYGVTITTDVKNSYLKVFADWLIKERELTETGYVLNLNLIYDVGLLKELQKFNDKGNFDRVSACILIAILIEDIVAEDIVTNQVNERDKFFNKPIFTKPNKNTLAHRIDRLGLPVL